MSTPYDIIIRPVMTEKSTELLEVENKVTFRVMFEATKPQIKNAVEQLFDVKVDRVNTLIMPGKPKRVGRFFGRRKAWKKAIVQLHPEDSIELFEGEEA